MNTKTSNKDYVGDPVLHKTADDNQGQIYQANFIWAEKGGAAACWVINKRIIVSFDEDPNSVKTNFIKFNTNITAYASSNYPDLPCALLSGQQSVSLGVWYNPDITDAEIDRQTKILGGPWTTDGSLFYPGDITRFVTQPVNPKYTGKIYVILRIPINTGYNEGYATEFSDYQYEVRR